MELEIWKPIPGFGNHYEASNMGRVRVKDRTITKRHSHTGNPCSYFYAGRILKPTIKKGYATVHIGVNGEKTELRVNRAVLMAFVGPPPDGTESCHNNGRTEDNSLSNLRWDTHHNNNQDRLLHDTYARGENHPMNRYSKDDINAIRNRSLNFKEAQAKLGISLSHFYRIRRGESWAHL